MKDLYIIGASGFDKEVAWLVERVNKENKTWNIKGVIEDNPDNWKSCRAGCPTIGRCHDD